MEQLLTIGEFAHRCGLSRSALRFYDQNDLLRPDLVDEDSGYRYYAPGQLEQAQLVRRLRSAELPVAVLREYLRASTNRRRAILEVHAASFRERASAVQREVDRLRDELESPVAGHGARSCAVDLPRFADALDQVGFAVADPSVRAELGAVWVETKDGSLRLVATDSYRLAVRDLVPDRVGSIGVRGVIEAGAARRLADRTTPAGTLVLAQSESGAMTALIGGQELTVGGPGDGFPDYERILLGLPAGNQIALARDELEQALAGLPQGAAHLSLSFDSGGLTLRTRGRQARVTGAWTGPELTMFVDPGFFAEAVRATVGPDVVIEASDPLTPITLRSADTGTFSVLTMPIRPPDPS